jgi:hypothetical protein
MEKFGNREGKMVMQNILTIGMIVYENIQMKITSK